MKVTKVSSKLALVLMLLLVCSLAGSLNVAYADPYARKVKTATDGGGIIENEHNIEGISDGNYATMAATFTNDDKNTSIIIGEMTGLCIGEIAVRCRNANPAVTWIGMMVYTIVNYEWNLVGTINITSSNFAWYDITDVLEPGIPPYGGDYPEGYAPEPYNYLALLVIATSPDWLPIVHVDAVSAEPVIPPPPFPPGWYPLTVNICDNYGNPLAGTIYLNGYVIGYTSVTINLYPGQYELYTTVFDTAHYVFQNYTVNIGGQYTTNNPTPIYFTMPAMVNAHFHHT